MHTIEISNKDVNKITMWCMENLSYIESLPLKFPFTQFCIKYTDEDSILTIKLENNTKGSVILKSSTMGLTTKAKFAIKNNDFRVHSISLIHNGVVMKNYPTDKIKAGLDNYMDGVKQTLAYINSKDKQTKSEKMVDALKKLFSTETPKPKTIVKRGVKYTYKKPSYTKINSKVYNKSTNQNSSDFKRKYIRRMDSWEVRGHWVTSKTGKRFWRQGYIKGGSKKSDSKTYKL